MDKPRLKAHEQKISFPGEDYTPDLPLPDIRLEHFAVLISRNVSKRGAVIQSFPLASPSSAAFRASRILQDDKVRDRIAYLRRRICAATASETPAEIARAAFAGEAAETALDGQSDNIGHSIDKTGHGNDNLGHSSDNIGHSEKRRLPSSGDLTPAELRRIISDGARAGMPAAIQAAIKMLDAKLSAPAAYADPAAICAVLFNGGGGGESLDVVLDRLAQTYGAQQVIDAMSHNKAYVTYIDNARAKGIKPQDIAQHTDTHGADVGSVDSGGLCAQDDAGETYTDTGSMGEGGEDAGVEGVYGCSENFEAPKYTNRLKPPLRPQDVAGATNDAGPPPH